MSPSGVFSVRCTSRDVYLYMVLKLLNDNCNEMKSAETGIFGIVCGIREYLCLLIHVFFLLQFQNIGKTSQEVFLKESLEELLK